MVSSIPSSMAGMNVIDWLLDSDPAIRWQVMRDLTDAPADEVAAERARVAREGWGAQLLAAQDPDGRWSGGTFFPEWISTEATLRLLYVFGLDPASEEARRATGERNPCPGAAFPTASPTGRSHKSAGSGLASPTAGTTTSPGRWTTC